MKLPRARGHVHLIGMGGAGVRALADYLLDSDCGVSGSDAVANKDLQRQWERRGVELRAGHAAENLPLETSLVVFSPAIGPENCERAAARGRGIPEISYPQMLGRISRGDWPLETSAAPQTIGVAGTHGKSTVTALIGTLLDAAHRNNSLICGAELLPETTDDAAGGIAGWRHLRQTGGPEYFVVESCEYRRHFLEIAVQTGVILNIESDHFDCFPSFAETVSAFREFAAQCPVRTPLIVESRVGSLLRPLSQPCITFSIDLPADYQLLSHQPTGWGSRFEWRGPNNTHGSADLAVPGQHNLSNALAAVAVCHQLGLTATEIAAGFQRFRGLRRRFECRIDRPGTRVIEDYAHHPTAVRAVIETASSLPSSGPRPPVRVIFQPHQISRVLSLMDDFVASFSRADEVWILPIFAARESADARINTVSATLAAHLRAQGVLVFEIPSLPAAAAALTARLANAAEHSTWLIMGAGDIHQLAETIARR